MTRETYFPIGVGESLLCLGGQQPRFPGVYWTASSHGVDYIGFRPDIARHVVRLLKHRNQCGESRITATLSDDEVVFNVEPGRLVHRELNALGYLDFTALATTIKPCPPPVAPPLPIAVPAGAVRAAVDEILGSWSPEFSLTANIYAGALLDGVLRPLDHPRDWPLVPIAVGAHLGRHYSVGAFRSYLGDEAWDVGVSGVHALALGRLYDVDRDIRVGPSHPRWTYVHLEPDTYERHGVSLGQLSTAFRGNVYAVASLIGSPSAPGEPGISPR